MYEPSSQYSSLKIDEIYISLTYKGIRSVNYIQDICSVELSYIGNKMESKGKQRMTTNRNPIHCFVRVKSFDPLQLISWTVS